MKNTAILLYLMLLSMAAFSSPVYATFIYDITSFEQNGFLDDFSDGNEPAPPTYWFSPGATFDPSRESAGMLKLHSDDAGLLGDSLLIGAALNINTYYFIPGVGGYVIGSFEFNDGFWPETDLSLAIANFVVSGPPPTIREDVYITIYTEYTDSSDKIYACYGHVIGDIDNNTCQDITAEWGTTTKVTMKLSVDSSNQVSALFDYGSDGTFDLTIDNFTTLAFYPQSEGDRLYSGLFAAGEDAAPAAMPWIPLLLLDE